MNLTDDKILCKRLRKKEESALEEIMKKYISLISAVIYNIGRNTLSKEDIVAGCLYEMTFFGFSEKKVIQTRDDMYKDIEESKAERK